MIPRTSAPRIAPRPNAGRTGVRNTWIAAHGNFEPLTETPSRSQNFELLTETSSCSPRLPSAHGASRCSRKLRAAHRDLELPTETSMRSRTLRAAHRDLELPTETSMRSRSFALLTETSSRSPRLPAAHGDFDLVTRTSQAPRAPLAVGALSAGPSSVHLALDSSVGSPCSPRGQTDSKDRWRCRRRELDPARTCTRGGRTSVAGTRAAADGPHDFPKPGNSSRARASAQRRALFSAALPDSLRSEGGRGRDGRPWSRA